MNIKAAAFLCAALAAAGCTPTTVPDPDRNAARQAVLPVVQQVTQGTGQDPARATECIIQSAAPSELARLAQAAGSPATPQTAGLVFQIAQRPPAVVCLQQVAA